MINNVAEDDRLPAIIWQRTQWRRIFNATTDCLPFHSHSEKPRYHCQVFRWRWWRGSLNSLANYTIIGGRFWSCWSLIVFIIINTFFCSPLSYYLIEKDEAGSGSHDHLEFVDFWAYNNATWACQLSWPSHVLKACDKVVRRKWTVWYAQNITCEVRRRFRHYGTIIALTKPSMFHLKLGMNAWVDCFKLYFLHHKDLERQPFHCKWQADAITLEQLYSIPFINGNYTLVGRRNKINWHVFDPQTLFGCQ